MERKYQIFVSSTYEDLKDERKEVVQAILKCNCIPAGMELWPASSKSQWEIIKSVIDESDYYLLIIAGKYGSEGMDDDGKKIGYTEMEFDYAMKTGKPIIALIHKDPESLPAKHCESSKIKKKKLENFKKKVMSGRLIHFWDSKEDLKTETVISIHDAIQKYPVNGWVRCALTCNNDECKVREFKVIQPVSFNDYADVFDCIENKDIAIINFDGVPYDVSSRLIDFISGRVYAANGQIIKIADRIFAVLPEEVHFASVFDTME